jgi:TRAP-type C4-dicarboxylate transport system permease small subunit
VKIVKNLDENLEKYILILLLIIMTVVMFSQVFMRYVLNNSITWAEEFTRYCFIFSTFFSISYCIKKNSSLRIDMVVRLLPDSISKVIDLVAKVLILVFFIYFTFAAFDVVQKSMNVPVPQKSPALQMPMYVIYMSVLVGFLLTTIRSI